MRQTQIIQLSVVGLVITLALVVGALTMKQCSTGPTEVITLGIDAGPGEAVIAAELDGAVQAAQHDLERLEEAHAADIAAFEGTQVQKYEDMRRSGPQALERWFETFNASLLPDSGRP